MDNVESIETVYKIYVVIEDTEHFRKGDEVALLNDTYGDNVFVAKITLAKKPDMYYPLCTKKSYWFTGRDWIDIDKLRYLRTE